MLVIKNVPKGVLEVFEKYAPEFVDGDKIIIYVERKNPNKKIDDTALHELDMAISKLRKHKIEIERVRINKVSRKQKYSFIEYDFLFDLMFMSLVDYPGEIVRMMPKSLQFSSTKLRFRKYQPILPRSLVLSAIFTENYPVFIIDSNLVLGVILSKSPGIIDLKTFLRWFKLNFNRINKNRAVLKFKYGNMTVFAVYNMSYLRKIFVRSIFYFVNPKKGKVKLVTFKYTATIRPHGSWKRAHAPSHDIIIEQWWTPNNTPVEFVNTFVAKSGIPFSPLKSVVYNRRIKKLKLYVIFDPVDRTMLVLLLIRNDRRSGIHYKVYQYTGDAGMEFERVAIDSNVTVYTPNLIYLRNKTIIRARDTGNGEKTTPYPFIIYKSSNVFETHTDEIITPEGKRVNMVENFTGFILIVSFAKKTYSLLLPPQHVFILSKPDILYLI